MVATMDLVLTADSRSDSSFAEQFLKEGIEAMTIEVVTRNEAALHLYHKLGYDTMSMVSLRKEFGENRRDRQAEFLGLRFRI